MRTRNLIEIEIKQMPIIMELEDSTLPCPPPEEEDIWLCREDSSEGKASPKE